MAPIRARFNLAAQRPALAVLCLLALLVLAGCATPPLVYSGFVSNPGQLQIDPDRNDKAAYLKPQADFKSYRKAIIAEPEIIYSLAAKERRLPADLKQRLISEMRAAVSEAVFDHFLVTDTPGPDTLLIRTALAGVLPTADVGGLTVVERVPINLDDTHMEAEVLDSVTGERLYAVVDTRYGRGIPTVQDMIRWDQVRKVLREWTATLRHTLAAR